jgi:hypothetical protein
VRTREGNAGHVTGNLGSSLLASRFLVEGPIPDDTIGTPGPHPRSTFFLAGRRTYFDQVLRLVKFDFPYYFYDLVGKATFNYSDDIKLALSGLWSIDRLDLGTGGRRVFMDWGNRLASASWQQFWTPKVSSHTYLSFNNYFYDIGLGAGLIDVRDTVNELGLRSSSTWQLKDDNDLSAGIEATYSGFRYNVNMLNAYRFDITGQPLSAAAWVQAKLKPFSALLIQPGLRVDEYHLWGSYSAQHLRPSPRLSFKYFLDDITAIKGAVGRYYQYSNALSPEFSPVPSLFVWVPLFRSAAPQQADHAILGVERWVDENTNVTLEGYYKHFGAIHEMSATYKPDSLETTLLKTGRGYSTGLDLLVRRDWGKLTGWLSYSLGFARVTYDSLSYAPSYDRRHILNLVASYQLPAGFNLTAHFSYGSGLPYTATVGYYRVWHYDYRRGRIVYDYTEIGSGKNAARYPDYHRLDLGVEKNFNIGKTRLSLQLQVINVYNHKNLLLYQWDYDQPVPLRTDFNQIPRLPSIGLKWNF